MQAQETDCRLGTRMAIIPHPSLHISLVVTQQVPLQARLYNMLHHIILPVDMPRLPGHLWDILTPECMHLLQALLADTCGIFHPSILQDINRL